MQTSELRIACGLSDEPRDGRRLARPGQRPALQTACGPGGLVHATRSPARTSARFEQLTKASATGVGASAVVPACGWAAVWRLR